MATAAIPLPQQNLPVNPGHTNHGPIMHRLRIQLLEHLGYQVSIHDAPATIKDAAKRIDRGPNGSLAITALGTEIVDIGINGPEPRQGMPTRTVYALVETAAEKIYWKSHRVATQEEIEAMIREDEAESKRCAEMEAQSAPQRKQQHLANAIVKGMKDGQQAPAVSPEAIAAAFGTTPETLRQAIAHVHHQPANSAENKPAAETPAPSASRSNRREGGN